MTAFRGTPRPLVATALALAGVLAFQCMAIRTVRSGCTGALAQVPYPHRSVSDLEVRASAYIGPASESLLATDEWAGLLGDVEIHVQALRHYSHADTIIGHKVLYLRARTSCSGGKLTPPFHERYEPPYRLLYVHREDVFVLAASGSEPPLLAFRRVPRLPPTAAVEAGRIAGFILLGLAVLSWLAAVLARRRTSRSPWTLLLVAWVLAAAALASSALGWSTDYLAR